MLDRLQPRPGARHRVKRVGRGPGSGHHKTSGRGVKGQGKRSAGNETPAYFEGGQNPLTRSSPKRGFHSLAAKDVQIVNTGMLARFGEGAKVDIAALVARGLVRRLGGPVKLLGNGDAPRGIRLEVHGASESAKRKVEEAGGSVEIVA